MAVSGFAIGGEIAKALGLPPGTTFIQISIGLDAAVEVLCRYYPDEAAVKQALATIKRYHLHEADGPPVSAEDAAARERDREVHEWPERRRQLMKRMYPKET